MFQAQMQSTGMPPQYSTSMMGPTHPNGYPQPPQQSPLFPPASGGTNYGMNNRYPTNPPSYQNIQRNISNPQMQSINPINQQQNNCNYGPGTSQPQMMIPENQRMGNWNNGQDLGHQRNPNYPYPPNHMSSQQQPQHSVYPMNPNTQAQMMAQQQAHQQAALQNQINQQNAKMMGGQALKRKISSNHITDRAPKQFIGQMPNQTPVPFHQQTSNNFILQQGGPTINQSHPSPMYHQNTNITGNVPSPSFHNGNIQHNGTTKQPQFNHTPNPSPYSGNFENQNTQQNWHTKKSVTNSDMVKFEIRQNIQAKQAQGIPIVRAPPTPPSQGSVNSNSSPQNVIPMTNTQVPVYPSPSSVGSAENGTSSANVYSSNGQINVNGVEMNRGNIDLISALDFPSPFDSCSTASSSSDLNISLSEGDYFDFKLNNGGFDFDNEETRLLVQRLLS
uniref:MamL-1 domain-containing protein n=1 Tax=Parastrongyloides trichosuri TaxID=131310 RepID=A0A0N4ZRW6_PARTI